MKVVLVEPEIPQNTGNIARLCGCVNIELILVGKLGFSLSNKHLKRAGLDYWQFVKVKIIDSIELFIKEYPEEEHQYVFISTKGEKRYNTICTSNIRNLLLIFGNETSGFPPYIYKNFYDKLYRIPMGKNIRSLNLSNAVGIVVYNLLEKNGFSELA